MIQIIPAIDLIDGQVVRLAEGDFERKTAYAVSALEVAKRYEAAGCYMLHLVDLDGAKVGHPVNLKILEELAQHTSLRIDVGGGLTTKAEIQRVFDAGASQVNLGTAAVKNPTLMKELLATHGPERIILSADVRESIVQIRGWQENTTVTIFDLIQNFVAEGLLFVTCTDIARDGMMSGPANSLYEEIQEKFPSISLIASGGVRDVDDIRALNAQGLFGVIIGKALLSGHLPIDSLQEFL